ncbi:uncharacterized protein LY89DRAFT_737474 [Mollisia scopiformis]|uniref:Uncharacterized protein n=1 Tax=Mollisia scopiformis TaxID=149040 RepID=A0A194WZX1_MOLSC|nr:uncharacterized protein LY89DRAFT_737474 [Mollisia scopiformis]KUJ13496.1 hypothetical protein LY89DRAFT_737474 [Mollisia scopiformis]
MAQAMASTNGNWFCQPVSGIQYSNVGSLGTYNRIMGAAQLTPASQFAVEQKVRQKALELQGARTPRMTTTEATRGPAYAANGKGQRILEVTRTGGVQRISCAKNFNGSTGRPRVSHLPAAAGNLPLQADAEILTSEGKELSVEFDKTVANFTPSYHGFGGNVATLIQAIEARKAGNEANVKNVTRKTK